MIRKALLTLPVAVLLLGVAGCGETKLDRGLSGAGIGAAGGAAAGLLIGGDPWTGAAIGGAIGGAAGALTGKEDVDLGEPAWR